MPPRFGQSQKSINLKNLKHKPKDANNSHMGTQMVELNEATC